MNKCNENVIGLVWINKIKKFLRLPSIDRALIIKVFFLTAIARFSMKKIPFKKLKKYMGKVNIESEYDVDNWDEVSANLRRFRWAILAVSKRTPWESKCLVQSLTAQYLMNKSGIRSTLYLGAKRDKKNNLIAHSWIRCGKFYVIGGNGEGYAITAKFTK